MAVYLCHEAPDLHAHDAAVIDARPGAVVLSRTAFHPGGGGQVSDVGTIESSTGTVGVSHVEVDGDIWWHVLDDPTAEPAGEVAVRVDAEHRLRVASLHTLSHVLNAFVFDEFEGSLVTGAQIFLFAFIHTHGDICTLFADRIQNSTRCPFKSHV